MKRDPAFENVLQEYFNSGGHSEEGFCAGWNARNSEIGHRPITRIVVEDRPQRPVTSQQIEKMISTLVELARYDIDPKYLCNGHSEVARKAREALDGVLPAHPVDEGK